MRLRVSATSRDIWVSRVLVPCRFAASRTCGRATEQLCRCTMWPLAWSRAELLYETCHNVVSFVYFLLRRNVRCVNGISGFVDYPGLEGNGIARVMSQMHQLWLIFCKDLRGEDFQNFLEHLEAIRLEILIKKPSRKIKFVYLYFKSYLIVCVVSCTTLTIIWWDFFFKKKVFGKFLKWIKIIKSKIPTQLKKRNYSKLFVYFLKVGSSELRVKGEKNTFSNNWIINVI